MLGLDAAGLPYAYEQYSGACTLEEQICRDQDLLTPEGARELEILASPGASTPPTRGIAVETVVTLVCFAVALVIFLRPP